MTTTTLLGHFFFFFPHPWGSSHFTLRLCVCRMLNKFLMKRSYRYNLCCQLHRLHASEFVSTLPVLHSKGQGWALKRLSPWLSPWLSPFHSASICQMLHGSSVHSDKVSPATRIAAENEVTFSGIGKHNRKYGSKRKIHSEIQPMRNPAVTIHRELIIKNASPGVFSAMAKLTCSSSISDFRNAKCCLVQVVLSVLFSTALSPFLNRELHLVESKNRENCCGSIILTITTVWRVFVAFWWYCDDTARKDSTIPNEYFSGNCRNVKGIYSHANNLPISRSEKLEVMSVYHAISWYVIIMTHLVQQSV